MSSDGRLRLPERRLTQTITFNQLISDSGYITHHCSYSCFADGRLAEVFMTVGKPGSPIEAAARDAAVILSIALQYGVPAEVIRTALTRNNDGSAAGAFGTALDMILEDKDEKSQGGRLIQEDQG